MGENEALELMEFDDAWSDEFAWAADRLRSAMGPVARRIEHIGSTAVPGMVAKPTIDVLVVVTSTAQVLSCADRLAVAGFVLHPDAWPDPDVHLLFRRVIDGRRTHHVHVVPVGSVEIGDYLAVRDYLRSQPGEAAAYTAHKRQLASVARGNREAYVAAKPVYVEELVSRARVWAESFEDADTAWVRRRLGATALGGLAVLFAAVSFVLASWWFDQPPQSVMVTDFSREVGVLGIIGAVPAAVAALVAAVAAVRVARSR